MRNRFEGANSGLSRVGLLTSEPAHLFSRQRCSSRVYECRTQRSYRLDAGGDALKLDLLERRQRAAVERGDESGAPSVGDLGAVEVEALELLQSSSRPQPRACRRRRRHEGGEALGAELVVPEV